MPDTLSIRTQWKQGNSTFIFHQVIRTYPTGFFASYEFALLLSLRTILFIDEEGIVKFALSLTDRMLVVALDELNDISDPAQVAVFVRAINHNFDHIEELLRLASIHKLPKEDICLKLKSCGD
ncbi:hypothetical protein RF11_00575 [Thelohanellus kitauei]|uniref:Uncharacterized protein n=1 Tax=Thelohanellus kitauei TaxID=669202 RepID=A0A0C2N3H4_THEKT|nr:hypothetical protein RF11_00575 [Thelohanellus kitauei]